MGAVAAQAADIKLAVFGVRLRGMAAGARRSSRRPRVRLMTLQAFLVAGWRAVGLWRMAAFAGSGLCTAVRFVAARALRVTCQRRVLLCSVAGGAAGLGSGVMRQAGVATVAVRMPYSLGDCAGLRCVATIAKTAISLR